MSDQIAIINSPVLITQVWIDFKSTVVSKNLAVQLAETTSTITLIAIDTVVTYKCLIFKTNIVSQIASAGLFENYTPVQNDLDRTDFETNFRSSCNSRLTSKISSLNSTTTPLAAGTSFYGTSEDTLGYSSIDISVKSDVASSNNGLQLFWSSDNTNFGFGEQFTIVPGSESYFSLVPRARFFKLAYGNGPLPQHSMLLSTNFTSNVN